MENYEWIQLTSTSEWNTYQNSTISYLSNSLALEDSDLATCLQLYDQLIQTIVISSVQSKYKKIGLSPKIFSSLRKIPL